MTLFCLTAIHVGARRPSSRMCLAGVTWRVKPVDQTLFGRPSGNCLPACVASILELPIEGQR